MWHELLVDEKFSAGLVEIDAAVARMERVRGCRFCAGPLHRADYPRKARGIPESERWFSRRFSFCCGWCRKRHTPQSVRFLGRRVYAGVAVLVATLTTLALSLAAGARAVGAVARTVRRWSAFMTTELPNTPFWSRAQGLFAHPIDCRSLPASLLERFSGSEPERMVRVLQFVAPITISAPD